MVGAGAREWPEPAATKRKPIGTVDSAPTVPLGRKLTPEVLPMLPPCDPQGLSAFVGNSFPFDMNERD